MTDPDLERYTKLCTLIYCNVSGVIRSNIIELKQEFQSLKSKLEEKLSVYHELMKFEGLPQLQQENQKLKEELEIIRTNKAHIPELAFKNGKAYCKKCGSDLE